MRKNPSAQFIRGGQTTQHFWAMATQVFSTGLKLSAAVYVVVFIGLIALNFRLEEVNEGYLYWIADLNVSVLNQPEFRIDYTTPDGIPHQATALELVRNPALRQKYEDYANEAELYYEISFVPATLAGLAMVVWFALIGRKLSDTEFIRGSRLVSPKDLDIWSRKKWKEYLRHVPVKKGTRRYTLAGIPFPPNTVEAQTGIFGTVGVGKTNAMKELLATIRAESGRALIYDKMGAFVRAYYNPETDIILNMFDARSVSWSPFLEAETPEAFAQIAEVMIQQKPGANDPFWSITARLVFEYAARGLMKQGLKTNAALRNAILTMPPEALEALVQNTPGALFFGESIQKTSASIRANMIAELRFLEFLRDDGIRPFSMRDWVKSDRPGFVFLTGDAEHSAATRNVISTVIEVAANALMTCPERRDPSLWFFLDEVPSLNRLPFLPTKLAEIRQFGGAFVLGYQVYSQLEDLYGDKAAQSISGTLNNRIVFNTPDARTARLFSDSLGLTDIIEHRETISFGADVTRDGNSLNAQRVERPIVTASEIQSLPQFRAYIRFGYDAPTALVQFPPISTPEIAPAIVKYEGNGFAIGAMDEVGQAEGAEVGDIDGDQDSLDGEENREEGALVADRGSRPVGAGSSKGTVGRGSSVAATAMERDVDQPFKLIPPRDKLGAFEAWFTERKRSRFDRQTFTEIPGLKETDRALAWEVWYRAKMLGHEVPQTILFLALDGLVTNHKGRGPDRVIQVPDYHQFVAMLPPQVPTPTVEPVTSAEAKPGKKRGKAATGAPIGVSAPTPLAAPAKADRAPRPMSKDTKPELATTPDAGQMNFALVPPVDKGKRLIKRITAAKAGL
jgi:type IV conjugative transfer system coupling protein TraD